MISGGDFCVFGSCYEWGGDPIDWLRSAGSIGSDAAVAAAESAYDSASSAMTSVASGFLDAFSDDPYNNIYANIFKPVGENIAYLFKYYANDPVQLVKNFFFPELALLGLACSLSHVSQSSTTSVGGRQVSSSSSRTMINGETVSYEETSSAIYEDSGECLSGQDVQIRIASGLREFCGGRSYSINDMRPGSYDCINNRYDARIDVDCE